MSAPATFYLEQVASCARAADKALLPNQRETFLRAQAAWQEMADRSLRTVEAREQREADSRASKARAETSADHGAPQEYDHVERNQPPVPDLQG